MYNDIPHDLVPVIQQIVRNLLQEERQANTTLRARIAELEAQLDEYKKRRVRKRKGSPKIKPDQRRAVRDRDTYQCQHCKTPVKVGHVHHIDKDTRNNEMSNLVLLCRDCHAIVHGRYIPEI